MINSSMSGVSQAAHTHRHHHESQNGQDFKSLATSLQSGDLAGAQKAFQALQANAPKNASSTNNPMATDFNALGQALQSGDITSAQKAFATIQQDMESRKANRGAHRPIQPAPEADAGDQGLDGATLSISA